MYIYIMQSTTVVNVKCHRIEGVIALQIYKIDNIVMIKQEIHYFMNNFSHYEAQQ